MQATSAGDITATERMLIEPKLTIAKPQFHVTNAEAHWNLATRIGFRFVFSYFLLYNFPVPLVFLPFLDALAKPYGGLWNKLVPWVGQHLLALNISVLPNGSGDTTFNYVQLLCFLVLAAAATVIWSLLDRGRGNYGKLHQWLRLYLTITLGAWLMCYGAMKVFPAQMPPPSLSTLMQPLGESSPMGLLWNFMGASKAYSAFAGSTEMLAGLLLFVPGCTTLAALLAMGTMTNVFVLNMSYDVPVKLFSFHLLLMAIFLAGPDLRRLAELFLLHRRVELSAGPTLFRRKWSQRTAITLQLAFALFLAIVWLQGFHSDAITEPETVGAPLYGVWSVEEYSVDGKFLPPLISEEARWQRVVFDTTYATRIQPMNGPSQRYRLQLDKPKNAFSFTTSVFPNWKANFTYTNPSPGTLVVTGEMDGHHIIATLRRVNEPKFLLTTRGFHWISEYPFHR